MSKVNQSGAIELKKAIDKVNADIDRMDELALISMIIDLGEEEQKELDMLRRNYREV